MAFSSGLSYGCFSFCRCVRWAAVDEIIISSAATGIWDMLGAKFGFAFCTGGCPKLK